MMIDQTQNNSQVVFDKQCQSKSGFTHLNLLTIYIHIGITHFNTTGDTDLSPQQTYFCIVMKFPFLYMNALNVF